MGCTQINYGIYSNKLWDIFIQTNYGIYLNELWDVCFEWTALYIWTMEYILNDLWCIWINYEIHFEWMAGYILNELWDILKGISTLITNYNNYYSLIVINTHF